MKLLRLLAVPCALALGISIAFAEDDFTYTGTAQRDQPLVAWAHADRAEPVGDRLRVAFYNIENFTDGVNDGPDRTEALVEAHATGAAALLDEVNADIVLISEIENEATLNRLNKALAKPFPFGWVTHFGDSSDQVNKLNIALLSRLPAVELLELDFAPLTGKGRPTRGSLRASFDLGEEHRLVVYGVHLKSNFGYRPRNVAQREHALEIVTADAKAVQEDASVKWEVLLLGDFNVDPAAPEFAGDPSLRPLRGWVDLWRGKPQHERITIPTRYGDPELEFPPATFDRIYAAGDLTQAPWMLDQPGVLPRGVNTKQVSVKPGEDGHISDHYPVWVDVERDAK